MRRTLLVLALAAMPGLAAAQSVPVRTGEHGDFTRIVLDFSDRPDWRLDPGDGVWRLTTGTGTGFDLSQIHSRIGRDRIRDITQPAPGRIDIHLACDCTPRTYELRNEGLIIDVMAPGEGTGPETVLSGGDATAPSRLIRDLMAGSPLSAPGSRPRGSEWAAAEPAGPARAAPNAIPAPPPADRAAELRSSVLAGLARSADQGLVDLAARLPGGPEIEAPLPAPEAPRLPALEPGSNMRIDTRMERDRKGHTPPPSAAACPAALSGTRATWKAARREVALDGAPAELARVEAMNLIVGGFGAEAATILRPHREAGTDLALLHQIAGIVDAPGPAPDLRALTECSDLFALFAVLADPPGGPARAETLVAALEQFGDALRLQFGRRVMAALVAMGREEESLIVANALLRLDPSLERSDLKIRRFDPGDPAATEAEAREELAERTPEAAAALRSLIDGMRSRGEDVPADVIDHAAALAPELAPADRVALVASVVRAEIAQRNLAAAARRVDALRRLDSERAAGLEADLYGALAQIPEDAVFLQQASRFAGRPAPGEAQRLEIARRIAALHVPELALDHLAEGDDARDGEHLLAARLWLDRGDPARALDRLDAVEGPEAERLRAEARDRLAPPPIPAPQTVSSGPLSVIERSAALREKYRSLLAGE